MLIVSISNGFHKNYSHLNLVPEPTVKKKKLILTNKLLIVCICKHVYTLIVTELCRVWNP